MFTMLKQGSHYIDDKHGVYTEFVCSSVADVENLPTGANSEALDRPRRADGGAASVYVLSNERTWVLLIEG